MLKAIEIENFKAFGERTRIELAPITLIYGQNSAGKSSILQALNLLKQTHESRESGDSLLPRAEDGIVDLGSFRELLFDHDTSRVLRLGLEIGQSSDHDQQQLWSSLPRTYSHPTFGMEFGFTYGKETQEFGLEGLSLAVGALKDKVATFRSKLLGAEEQQDMLGAAWDRARLRRTKSGQRTRGVECDWVTDQHDWWMPMYQAWAAKRSDIATSLSSLVRDQLFPIRFGMNSGDGASGAGLRRAMGVAEAFYRNPFSLEAFVQRMTAGWRGTVLGIDGFLPTAGRFGQLARLPEVLLLDLWQGPGMQLDLSNNDIAGLAQITGHLVRTTLDSLFPMGPFRRPPERWYMFTGTSPADVGYQGDHLPDLLFRRPDLVDHANRWLTKLDIGYKLKVKSIGEHDSDLFEVRLVDTRRANNVDVGLSDVGFGISQILPFLVQSLATTNQIISIEQPEVHIHPRLQADLGELLAECVSATFGHQFLIETHSEHLVLRLQKLVRQHRLKPEDVSIVFVERSRSGSRVSRLNLDNRGEFIDEWPGGFFPERLRELM